MTDAAARHHYRGWSRVLGLSSSSSTERVGKSSRIEVSRGVHDPLSLQPGGASRFVPRNSADRLRKERLGGSRLIPVDAGTDPSACASGTRTPPGFSLPRESFACFSSSRPRPLRAASPSTSLRPGPWPSTCPRSIALRWNRWRAIDRAKGTRWSSPGQPPRFEVTLPTDAATSRGCRACGC